MYHMIRCTFTHDFLNNFIHFITQFIQFTLNNYYFRHLHPEFVYSFLSTLVSWKDDQDLISAAQIDIGRQNIPPAAVYKPDIIFL